MPDSRIMDPTTHNSETSAASAPRYRLDKGIWFSTVQLHLGFVYVWHITIGLRRSTRLQIWIRCLSLFLNVTMQRWNLQGARQTHNHLSERSVLMDPSDLQYSRSFTCSDHLYSKSVIIVANSGALLRREISKTLKQSSVPSLGSYQVWDIYHIGNNSDTLECIPMNVRGKDTWSYMSGEC